MATHHAKPNKIVGLETIANDIPVQISKTITRTIEVELPGLVISAGHELEEHS